MTKTSTHHILQEGVTAPMPEKFALQTLPRVMALVRQQAGLERYDLSREVTLLDGYIARYRATYHRDPFTFDLLDEVFRQLAPALARRVKSILYEKDTAWFTQVGQYLFYNAFQWAQGFPSSPASDQDNSRQLSIPSKSPQIPQREFLNRFFTHFCEFEENSHTMPPNAPMVPAFPSKVLLELTNNCNLNCTMCGVGKVGYDPARTLPLRLLHTLRDDVLGHAAWIRLNGLGESTIIPEFLDYLEVLAGLPGQLEIVTNLTVQNERVWRALLDARTFFLISCDSAYPAHYEAIRRGAKFAWFTRNLEFIGRNLATPALAQFIFTLLPTNIDDLNGVIDLSARHHLGGVIVNISKLNKDEWLLKETGHILQVFHAAHARARDLAIPLKLPDHVGPSPVDGTIATPSACTACTNPWEEIYLRYNGDVTACNMLNPYIYGNCCHLPFAHLWQGLNAALFRSLVNTAVRHPYCRECYFLL